MKELRMWCYKVLPLVYDDSLSYYEVLCKLKAKINEMIGVIDDIPEAVKAYLDTDDFKAYIAQLVDTLKSGFVSVDDYGAKGDGETNDYQAFVDAFEVGNELGIPVIADGTKSYAINASSPIIVETDVNFNGATIVVKMDNGATMFEISQEMYRKTINQGGLSFDKVYDSDLFNKVIYILSPLSLGKRQGFGNEMFHEQMLVTDGAGHFVNAIYFPEIINGDYQLRYWDINFKHLTFENMVFVTDGNKGCNHIHCIRNNTTIQNIGFKGNSSFVGDGWTSMISVQWGYNVEVKNVIGEQAWPSQNTGYLVGFLQATDCVADNVKAQWRRGDAIHGDFGVSSATNMTFRNCNAFRFDCHYEMMGYWHIYDCTFLGGHVCGGWGTFCMENCTLPKDWNSGGSFPIGRRNDVSLPFSGTIEFKNITAEGNAGFFEYTMSGGIDEELEYIPPLSTIGYMNFHGTEIILDNIVFGPKIGAYNFMQVNDNLHWPDGTEDEDRYEWDTIITVKNTHFWRNAPQCVGWGRIRKYVFENCIFDDYLALNMQATDLDIINCKFGSNVYFMGEQKIYGNLRVINSEFDMLNRLDNLGSYHKTLVLIGNVVNGDQDILGSLNTGAFTNMVINDNVVTTENKTYLDDWNSGAV